MLNLRMFIHCTSFAKKNTTRSIYYINPHYGVNHCEVQYLGVILKYMEAKGIIERS